MAKSVGIDLGTTNSVVAVWDGKEPRVIPASEGGSLCPSVVAYTPTGDELVGAPAKRQAVANPLRTILSIKRHIGTPWQVSIDGRTLTPEQVSATILRKLKRDAEAYLGEPVTHAVITVPAYFTDAQRQSTRDAGTLAGLEVLRIINEPTAAALAYGLHTAEMHTVLVWDLGGGTFDVSILELDAGVFEVRATCGDTALGGDDWDARIVSWIAAGFEREHGLDARSDRSAAQRLREAAERVKVELSSSVSAEVNLPFLAAGSDGPLHLQLHLSRAAVESMCGDLLERMVTPTRQALADASLQPHEVDAVVLVGGSTRMPAVQALARRIFGKEPVTSLNPDESIAMGAAIQAGVMAGDVEKILLLDVTPLSLGIETLGGVLTRVIERNSTIPTQRSQVFSTARDYQDAVIVRVYQGERQMARENKFLAEFRLEGIPPAPRGTPQIEVAFDIDANGILHVSAHDLKTGNKQSVRAAETARAAAQQNR